MEEHISLSAFRLYPGSSTHIAPIYFTIYGRYVEDLVTSAERSVPSLRVSLGSCHDVSQQGYQ